MLVPIVAYYTFPLLNVSQIMFLNAGKGIRMQVNFLVEPTSQVLILKTAQFGHCRCWTRNDPCSVQMFGACLNCVVNLKGYFDFVPSLPQRTESEVTRNCQLYSDAALIFLATCQLRPPPPTLQAPGRICTSLHSAVNATALVRVQQTAVSILLFVLLTLFLPPLSWQVERTHVHGAGTM